MNASMAYKYLWICMCDFVKGKDSEVGVEIVGSDGWIPDFSSRVKLFASYHPLGLPLC